MNKARLILITIFGCLAITLAAISVFKLVTPDYEGRPSDQTLKSEFLPIHEFMGGNIEYVNKPLFRAVTGTVAMIGKDRKDIPARLKHVAKIHGWRSVNQTSVNAKFCKNQLALSLEIIDDPISPRMEYGVFWVADKASFLYCNE